jgi:hypothetical protein
MRKVFAALLLLAAGSLALAKEPPRLVVHEWGTFTSISAEDGGALDYRPLTGVSDLPSFVYTSADPAQLGIRGAIRTKGDMDARVRMETPVIYFYSDVEQRVSVKVDFPKGKITEFYPRARAVKDGTIDWGTLLVRASDTEAALYPTGEDAAQRNHYFRAREVDANPVRVCSRDGTIEHEKFLFYRGVGDFELPVKVKLDASGRDVTVEDSRSDAIVFENRKGVVSFTRISPPREGSTSTVARPTAPSSVSAVSEELVKILVAEGLYVKEARAMVATWKDTWFEEGLRVLYVLPRSKTDEVLPLTMTPKPTELVRVLVGRAEVITPELEAEVLETVARLGAEKFEEREAAQKALARHGRFARPILRTAAKRSRDAEVSARIRRLLSD